MTHSETGPSWDARLLPSGREPGRRSAARGWLIAEAPSHLSQWVTLHTAPLGTPGSTVSKLPAQNKKQGMQELGASRASRREAGPRHVPQKGRVWGMAMRGPHGGASGIL